MNNGYPSAYQEVAKIAQDIGILEAIPKSDDALVFTVDKLFQHIRREYTLY